MIVRGLRGARAIWRGQGAGWRWLGAALLVGGGALVFLSFSGSGSGSDDTATSRVADSTDQTATDSGRQGQAPGDDGPAPDDKDDQPDGPGEAQPDGKGGPDPRDAAASEGRGSIHETVDTVPTAAVADPVGIDDTAKFGNGVEARLASIEAIEAEAFLPGEFSGPAVAMTVEVTNGSSETINLDTVTVDLTFADRLSASPVTDPERTPLSGDLGAGETATGDYIFTLAPDEREGIQVRIGYAAETPTVVFAGSVADG